MVVTEAFLKTYNATFDFIHKRLGEAGLIDYWRTIAPIVAGDLIELVQKHGLWGAYRYWSHTLAEEGVDHVLTYDRGDDAKLTLEITDCASRKKIGNPCPMYCRHCDVVYREVLEPLGYKYEWQKTGDCACQIVVTSQIPTVEIKAGFAPSAGAYMPRG